MRLFWTLLALAAVAAEPSPDGNTTIHARAGPSDIIITTTNRVAGAIHSLTWNGKEFIDSTDHGRQLQSASNFDCGEAKFIPEVFNPTEAGSRSDHVGPTSTSRLLTVEASGNRLCTTSQMAFWLRPNEKSLSHPARNTVALSDHRLTKSVTIGYRNLPHAIDYRVTFTVPPGEKHNFAQFEALTGYMPAEFGRFWKYLPRTDALEEAPPVREYPDPVAIATASGSHAMGVFSPDQPSAGFEQAGYGLFHFPEHRVNKWNCVFRVKRPDGVQAGDYSYRVFVAVGTLDDVRRTLATLASEFRR